MIEIDLKSAVPLYDQIKAGLKGMAARGLLKPGDAVPSVRALAVELRINPNTVARAIRELVMEGFLESRRGEGNVVSAQAMRRVKDGVDAARGGFCEDVARARRSGLEWRDIEALVNKVKREEK